MLAGFFEFAKKLLDETLTSSYHFPVGANDLNCALGGDLYSLRSALTGNAVGNNSVGNPFANCLG